MTIKRNSEGGKKEYQNISYMCIIHMYSVNMRKTEG